jgi:hypothetical protein
MMTVDEILFNFRAALAALVPMAERAGIGWRRRDAYDQWDNIAGSLFSGLVEEPLRQLFPASERERFALPAYDLLVERCESPAVVEVLVLGDPRARLFHAFETEDTPFDTCESRLMAPGAGLGLGEIERHRLDHVHFRVCYRADDGAVLHAGGDRDEVTGPV